MIQNNILGAGGDQHVIEGEMLNLPEPSIDAPCPPDYSSYDEIAEGFVSGRLSLHFIIQTSENIYIFHLHIPFNYFQIL